ncbi:MAG: succinylglutamate desuccinylase/aspartoacylase family protein [Gammaproteobacteria bacterium]|nr:succinylglutamate desuccinylase/aspartoacylase family protein [Gammaproteobacteria bacterium]
MKNANLTICNATIHPGETANLALPLPELYSCTSFYMPIKVVHGHKPGPCLLIFSAAKGDELNGIEIVNQLLSDQSQRISGTLILVPVLNISGLVAQSGTQAHETNLDGCFPGAADGSYGERLAHIFTQEILSKVDYCIELKTGSLNHELLPQIYCNQDDKEAMRLAQQFAAPVITSMNVVKNSLQQTTEQLNIPLLIYRAGEAMRFNEAAIKLGVSGIHNVMQTLGIIEPTAATDETEEPFKPVISQDQDWIRVHRSGVLFSEVELGQMVFKGQVIGRISDPFSSNSSETVRTSQDGIIVGINRHPLIHEGQTIFKIASFIDNSRAQDVLETWHNQAETVE